MAERTDAPPALCDQATTSFPSGLPCSIIQQPPAERPPGNNEGYCQRLVGRTLDGVSSLAWPCPAIELRSWAQGRLVCGPLVAGSRASSQSPSALVEAFPGRPATGTGRRSGTASLLLRVTQRCSLPASLRLMSLAILFSLPPAAGQSRYCLLPPSSRAPAGPRSREVPRPQRARPAVSPPRLSGDPLSGLPDGGW